MKPSNFVLKDGSLLFVREATREDAGAMLEYVESISGESDFLTFGPGEFGVTMSDEADFLERSYMSPNRLCLVAFIGGELVGSLTFQGGARPRTRHCGEMGVSVRKAYWGLEIASYLIDLLLGWAREGGLVRKINLRVRSDNERGILLYERKGFLTEGKVSRDIFLKGRFHECIYMGIAVD